MTQRLAKRVLLVGWDAADWRFILPLIEQGAMPTLERLMRDGVWGQLASIQPMLSPMLWTSIATGKRPHRHGIFGFVEPAPDASDVRPVSSASRRCPAVWNMLARRGLRSVVVGWYASHPAERIAGACVSNLVDQSVGPSPDDWPMPADAVHPPELAPAIAALRVHPHELTGDALAPFLTPVALGRDPRSLRRLPALRRLLAQTSTVHAIATHLIGSQAWDLAAVYYEGIDRFGHEFMPFHPPRMDAVSPDEFACYADAMAACYRFHDMMLQALLQYGGDELTTVLVSDHGYYHDGQRPARPFDASPVDWHRPLGVACLHGPGVRQGQRLFGGTVLDVTPTVLRLLGLPVGQDMDGRPWVEAFDQPVEADRILSWDEPGGPAADGADPEAARQTLRHLADLGYVRLDASAQQRVEDAIVAARLNEALSLCDASLPREALPLLRDLHARRPDDEQVALHLALATAASGDAVSARAQAERLLELAHPPPQALLLLGSIELSAGRLDAAAGHLRRAEQLDPRRPAVLLQIAELHLRRRQWDDAERALQAALALDGDCALAFDGLARVALAREQPQDAVDFALLAVERAHFLPRAHLRLGLALAAIGNLEQAVAALRVCLKQAPNHREAHERIAELYHRLGDAGSAVRHELAARGLHAG